MEITILNTLNTGIVLFAINMLVFFWKLIFVDYDMLDLGFSNPTVEINVETTTLEWAVSNSE